LAAGGRPPARLALVTKLLKTGQMPLALQLTL
jgi:hypothetical protein